MGGSSSRSIHPASHLITLEDVFGLCTVQEIQHYVQLFYKALDQPVSTQYLDLISESRPNGAEPLSKQEEELHRICLAATIFSNIDGACLLDPKEMNDAISKVQHSASVPKNRGEDSVITLAPALLNLLKAALPKTHASSKSNRNAIPTLALKNFKDILSNYVVPEEVAKVLYEAACRSSIDVYDQRPQYFALSSKEFQEWMLQEKAMMKLYDEAISLDLEWKRKKLTKLDTANDNVESSTSSPSSASSSKDTITKSSPSYLELDSSITSDFDEHHASQPLLEALSPQFLSLLASRKLLTHTVKITKPNTDKVETREALTLFRSLSMTCESFVSLCAAMSGTKRISDLRQRFFRANFLYSIYYSFGMQADDFNALYRYVNESHTSGYSSYKPTRKHAERDCLPTSKLESVIKLTFSQDKDSPAKYSDSYGLDKLGNPVNRELMPSMLNREMLDVSKVVGVWEAKKKKEKNAAKGRCLTEYIDQLFNQSKRDKFIQEELKISPASLRKDEPPSVSSRVCYSHYPNWLDFHRWAATHSDSPILLPNFHGLLHSGAIQASLPKNILSSVKSTASAMISEAERHRLMLLAALLDLRLGPDNSDYQPKVVDERISTLVPGASDVGCFLLGCLTRTELATIAREVSHLVCEPSESLSERLSSLLRMVVEVANISNVSGTKIEQAVNAFVDAIDYLDPPSKTSLVPPKLGAVLAVVLLLRQSDSSSFGSNIILKAANLEACSSKYDESLLEPLRLLGAMLSMPSKVTNLILKLKPEYSLKFGPWSGLAPSPSNEGARIALYALTASSAVSRIVTQVALQSAKARSGSNSEEVEIRANLLSLKWLRDFSYKFVGKFHNSTKLLYEAMYPLPLKESGLVPDAPEVKLNSDDTIISPIDNSSLVSRSEGVLPSGIEMNESDIAPTKDDSPHFYFSHSLRNNVQIKLPSSIDEDFSCESFAIISPLAFKTLVAWFRGGPSIERPLRICLQELGATSPQKPHSTSSYLDDSKVIVWCDQQFQCSLELEPAAARVYLAPLPNSLPAPLPPGLDFVLSQREFATSGDGKEQDADSDIEVSSAASSNISTSNKGLVEPQTKASPASPSSPSRSSLADEGGVQTAIPSISIPLSRQTPLGAILPLLECAIAPHALPGSALHRFTSIKDDRINLSRKDAVANWRPSTLLYKYCRIWLTVSSHCSLCCNNAQLAQQPNVTYAVLLNKPLKQYREVKKGGSSTLSSKASEIASMTLGEAVARMHVAARVRVTAFMNAISQGMEANAAQASAYAAVKQILDEMSEGLFDLTKMLHNNEETMAPWTTMGNCSCFLFLVDRRLPYSLNDTTLADSLREALPEEAAVAAMRATKQNDGAKIIRLPGWTPGGVCNRADVSTVFDVREGLLLGSTPDIIFHLEADKLSKSSNRKFPVMTKITTTATTSVVTTSPQQFTLEDAVSLSVSSKLLQNTQPRRLLRSDTQAMRFIPRVQVGKHPMGLLSNGRTGLSNLGNTCFMNSALQALTHLPAFVEYFFFGLHRIERTFNNPLCSHQVAQYFAEFVQRLYEKDVAENAELLNITQIPLAYGTRAVASTEKGTLEDKKRKVRRADYITPKKLHRAIVDHYDLLGDGRQHDAQELLAVLLDAVHEGLNRRYLSPVVVDGVKQNCPEFIEIQESAEKSLQEVLDRHSAANRIIAKAEKLKTEAESDPSKVEEAFELAEQASKTEVPSPLEEAEVSFQRYMSRNRSIVTDLFGGRFKSTLTYLRCGRQSITFDPFLMLSLPIPRSPVTAPAAASSIVDSTSVEIPIFIVLRPPRTTTKCAYRNSDFGSFSQHDLSRKPIWLNVRVPTTTTVSTYSLAQTTCNIQTLKSCTLAALNKLNILREDLKSEQGFVSTAEKPFNMREFQILSVKSGYVEAYQFNRGNINPEDYNPILSSMRSALQSSAGEKGRVQEPWTKLPALICVQLPTQSELACEMEDRRMKQVAMQGDSNSLQAKEKFELTIHEAHSLAPRSAEIAALKVSDESSLLEETSAAEFDSDTIPVTKNPILSLRRLLAKTAVAERHLLPRAPNMLTPVSSPEALSHESYKTACKASHKGTKFPDPFRGGLSPGVLYDVVDTVNTWCPATIVGMRYVTPYVLASEKLNERRQSRNPPKSDIECMLLELKLRQDALKRLETQQYASEIFGEASTGPLILSGKKSASQVYQYNRIRGHLDELKLKANSEKQGTASADKEDDEGLLPLGLIADEHVDFIPDVNVMRTVSVEGVGHIPTPEDIDVEQRILEAENGDQAGTTAQAELELAALQNKLEKHFESERRGASLGNLFEEAYKSMKSTSGIAEAIKMLDSEPNTPQGWICQVRVHYIGWPKRWDEWIDVTAYLNMNAECAENEESIVKDLVSSANNSRIAFATDMARDRSAWSRDKIQAFLAERASSLRQYEQGLTDGIDTKSTSKKWDWHDEVDIELPKIHLIRVLHRSTSEVGGVKLFGIPDLVILPRSTSASPPPLASPKSTPEEKLSNEILWGPHTTLLDLYEAVWNVSAHRFAYEEGLPSLFSKTHDGKVWVPDRLPFVLVTTKSTGYSCSSCPWFKHCTGCPLLLPINIANEANLSTTVPHPALGYIALQTVEQLPLLSLIPDCSLVVQWDPLFMSRFVNLAEAESVIVGTALETALSVSRQSAGKSDNQANVKQKSKQGQMGTVGSVHTAAIMSVSLGLNGSGPSRKLSLFDCVAAFTSPELMTGDDALRCSKCKQNEDCAKRLELWTAPPYLIIHLKRLLAGRKLQHEVDAPMTGLDITPFLARRDEEDMQSSISQTSVKPTSVEISKGDIVSPTTSSTSSASGVSSFADSLPADIQAGHGVNAEIPSSSGFESEDSDYFSEADDDYGDEIQVKSVKGEKQSGSTTIYDLISTIEHRGSAAGGHYVAKALDVRTGAWHLYDDSWVSEIDESSVVTSNSYMLFYQRRDLVSTTNATSSLPNGSTEQKENAPSLPPKLERSSSLGSSLNLFTQGKQVPPPIVELLQRYLTADELAKLSPKNMEALATKGGSSALSPGGGAGTKNTYYKIEAEMTPPPEEPPAKESQETSQSQKSKKANESCCGAVSKKRDCTVS